MNNCQPKVNISYHWGIEDKKEGISLTWSSTLMKIKDELWWYINIIFDYWMHQWWYKSNNLNENIDNEILKADFLIITHAHMDHVWRIPMLIKNGFKWKIIMTNLTKQITQAMLSDYVRLTEKQISEVKEQNKKIWETFSRHIQAVKIYDELIKWWIKKNEREKKERKLEQLIWEKVRYWEIKRKNIKEKINEIKKLLKKYHIKNESDIRLIQKEEPVLLYDLDDVYKTISRVETIEVWNEINLDNRIFINNKDDNRIISLPKIIREWYNKKIFVLPHIKAHIVNKLKNYLNEIAKHNTENKNIREKLKKILKKNKKTDNEKKLLKKYWIEKVDDIENLKKEIIKFPYTYDEIKTVSKNLELVIDKNKNKFLESIKLNFHNAWHIEWSIQATVSIVTDKIIDLLWQSPQRRSFEWKKRIEREFKNFWFSWDLWKITEPNISWSPEIPSYRYDFFQCESTYADREHPCKKEEFKMFINEIYKTKWKVLIPAFSLQRTQEIMLELLQNKISKQDLIKKYWQLKQELRKLNMELAKLIWNQYIEKDYEHKVKNIKEKIEIISNEIDKVWEQVFLYEIIVDSPLSKEISDIFLHNLWEKYKLLDKKVQEDKIWKNTITYLEDNEYKKHYTDKRINKKDIILSSWWMLQWWAITNHIKLLIWDPNSKIIFTGYQAEWTLWRELIDWKKQIIIDWEVYDVNCQIVQIRWYSSHIWKNDLINYIWQYLNFSKKSIVALNHGWESRNHLAYEINKLNPLQKIEIPKLWDTIEIKL